EDENQQWLEALSRATWGIPGQHPAYQFSYSPEFTDKHWTESGRVWIRQNIGALARALHGDLLRIALAPIRPPHHIFKFDGIPILLLEIVEAGSSSVLGMPIDADREARRVVRNLLVAGASQIPHGQRGLVLIDVGRHVGAEWVQYECDRWLQDEGSG